jgi:hypothetical protein
MSDVRSNIDNRTSHIAHFGQIRECYSYLSASMGFMREALTAG